MMPISAYCFCANRGRRPVEQMATFCKAIAAIEGRKDYDAALQLFAEAKAFAPDSEIGKQVDQIRTNVEGMRDAAKAAGKTSGKTSGKAAGDQKDGGR